MIPVRDSRVIHTAHQIMVHNPWFVEFLEAWRASELDRLPYSREDIQTRQGRVQSLDELLKLFTNAEVDLARLKT